MHDFLELENLGGDFKNLLSSVRGGKPTSAFSLAQGAKIHIASYLNEFVLYVTADRLAANAAYEKLKGYFKNRAVLIADKDDVLLHRAAYSEGNTGKRIGALNDIVNGKAAVAVISAEAVMQYFPNYEKFKKGQVKLIKEEEFPPDELIGKLAASGYTRTEMAADRGTFALRGDILDIFPLSFDKPIRINFFGDYVESLKYFAPDTMESLFETDAVVIPPATDMPLTRGDADKIIEKLKTLPAEGHAAEIISDVIGKLEINPSDNTLVWLTPFIGDRGVIFDYLPKSAVIVFDEPKIIADKMELIEKEHLSRVKSLTEGGAVLAAHKNALLSKSECVNYTHIFKRLGFQQLTSMNPLFTPTAQYSFRSGQVTKYYLDKTALVSDLKNLLLTDYRVVLCCSDASRVKTVSKELRAQDVFVEAGEDFKKSKIIASTLNIKSGFIYHSAKLAVFGTEELFGRGDRKKEVYKSKSTFKQLKAGDYVVHEVHGVGYCEGTEKLTANGIMKDYVVLRYRDGDRLYVPIDQMDLLTKFTGGETPRLNKIGGKEFARVKEKAKASVKKLAFDLLALYKDRERQKGFKYSADTVWQREFEDKFEFELTDDQEKAVAEIKRDMEKGRVMDRLICGDVGYGKTEVAFRAVFKTLMDNRQAVILAPTTILAKQHYNTLCARMEGFGIKTALLSRLQSDKEIKAQLKGIADGTVSVAVGTHRLLSRDVAFHNLGLLVLDEEQRFGVEHKEKLKTIKKDVNVLTLTATPIPRTLNLALSGIRDISLLETPPKNRLPVQNYVVEYTDTLLKDAVMREVNRGGQVFVLYNYVESIEDFAAKLRKLVDGKAKVMVAHGQMPPAELDFKMTAFYQREADVLVATTIIENGLDLPDANTLFVCDADRFGLSELYQLRGRVGRSGALAHAYFTTRLNKVLSETAVKRLTALTEYAEFGSGFKISLRDLEIRGAGSFLGAEQHGHIEKIGYELYSKLLAESVDEIRHGYSKGAADVEIKIEVNAYISESYVSQGDKIRIYKRISEVRSAAERDELIAMLTDVYGPPEKPLVNLIGVALLKSLAARFAVKGIVVNKKGAAFIFGDADVFGEQGLMEAVAAMPEDVVLTATVPPQLLFNVKGITPEECVAKMTDFLLKAEKTS